MLSRRNFLKAAGAGLGGASLAASNVQALLAGPMLQGGDPDGAKPDFWEPTLYSYNEYYNNPPLLGRVQANRLSIFEGPSPDAGRIRDVYQYYVTPIYRGVIGERYDQRWWSPVWYDIGEGFLHSGMVIPVREIFNPVHTVMPPEGFFWGEVTVPMATQWKQAGMVGGLWDWSYYRGFYGQVYKIVEYAQDASGMEWYRIEDDVEPLRKAWILAKAIRRIAPEEFAPINPHVTDKRIEINLSQQVITCFEEGQPVFKTRIASGTSQVNDQGELIDFSTPYGTTPVMRKLPSRRMRGNESGIPWDVNAVGWCTYFSETGAAIHGTYWHNNYGLPRSKGCINVTTDAAKWIFRWSQPYVGYYDVTLPGEYRWTAPDEVASPVEVVGEIEEEI